MIPTNVSVIHVNADKVANWDMQITLKEGSLALLEQVAGAVRDACWGSDDPKVESEWDDEPWGWFPDWEPYFKDRARTKIVGLWFREPDHAVYFKLLWGGL